LKGILSHHIFTLLRKYLLHLARSKTPTHTSIKDL